MPTRMVERFKVYPVVEEDDGTTTSFEGTVAQEFKTNASATDRAKELSKTTQDNPRIGWVVQTIVKEVTPDIPDMTIEELVESWDEWQDVQRMPMKSDSMGVADDYLNFPGDMEMYSDYASEIAKEYTRRTNESIVDAPNRRY